LIYLHKWSTKVAEVRQFWQKLRCSERDIHRADPLASLELEAEDFGWITAELASLAKRHSGGRLISLLEGGYNLDALGASAAAHVRALLEA
jgi:acetoin utilization deacetylase AcuC-like enzyme